MDSKGAQPSPQPRKASLSPPFLPATRRHPEHSRGVRTQQSTKFVIGHLPVLLTAGVQTQEAVSPGIWEEALGHLPWATTVLLGGEQLSPRPQAALNP